MSVAWPAILATLTMAVLLAGVPVAFALAGTALLVGVAAILANTFDLALWHALPARVFAIFVNDYLLAIPGFVLMGVVIEKTGVARAVVADFARMLENVRGGLPISVILAGTVLASVTGVVGASIVALGLIAAKPMLEQGVAPSRCAGVICAAGTLGQLVPPSIVLLLLADVIQNANSEAQLALGNFAPDPVTVIDLFAGAVVPATLMVALYVGWLIVSDSGVDHTSGPNLLEKSHFEGERQSGHQLSGGNSSRFSISSLLLVGLAVLMMAIIFSGVATVTEAASVGAIGAMVIAIPRGLVHKLRRIAHDALVIASSIFAILVGATIWSLTFRGLGGDEVVQAFVSSTPGGLYGALFLSMALIFVAGFFLELVEILLIIVPLVAPPLMLLGADPIWLAIMIGVNLQTSFLTPPMGVSLFYFKSVSPPEISTAAIYLGIVPFVLMQLVVLMLIACFPLLATLIPEILYR